MDILQNPRSESKGNGAAPPSRHHDPAAIVPLPTALTPKHRRRHGEDARPFKTRLPALVGHLHGLGVRPTAELLVELVGHDEQARNTLLLLLERYGRLSPAVVEAVNGDRFSPAVFAVANT